MGVPTFYKWLVTRYPKIAKAVYETRDSDVYLRRARINENGESYKVYDLGAYVNNTDEKHCSDNVNGYFDNMYLDMNGIIHLCSHGDGSKKAKSDEEIFLNIFLYIERLFDIIEPQKLLYMAIDGVAPKAKMNQQRSRRFKSILASEIEKRAYIELRNKFLSENRNVPDEYNHWDSNIITPGTQFMHELSIALKYFIEHKITNDEKWKKIVVIFSDANVCGEGEHKIYNFIKSQRAQKGYDPNTRHVIHGMDADLIMLSLASHEPYFYILREIINLDQKDDDKPQVKDKYVGVFKGKGDLQYCTKFMKSNNTTTTDGSNNKGKKKYCNKYNDRNYANINMSSTCSINYENWNELQILDLTILREYLYKDFFFDTKYNLERCIDDFIFICFLCGNDFLPHLPSISIASGSIDQLILLYQKVLPVLGDYLINEGSMNFQAFTKYISFIAEVERETFVSQYDFKKKREKRELQKDAFKRPKCQDEGIKNGSMSQARNGRTAQHHDQNYQKINTDNGNNPSNPNEQPPYELNTNPTISKKTMYENKIQSMQPIRNFKFKEKKGEKSINFLVRSSSSTTIETSANGNMPISENNKMLHEDKDEGNINDSANINQEIPNNIFNDDQFDNIHNIDNNLDGGENNESQIEEALDVNPDGAISEEESPEMKKLNDIVEFNLLLKEAIKKANECENPKEDVELGADDDPHDLRTRYYKSKFHLDESDNVDEFVKEVVYKYIEGLAWVLCYYFQACPMWHWYYPYYYAPLSSDLLIKDISISFEEDEPLLPFEQLLCVLPSNSSHCLPKMYRELMLKNESPIVDFYPKTFKEEENGKKFKYQWIVLLPFVEKERIIRFARDLDDTLTDEEKKRNRRGLNKIYMSSTHILSKKITTSMRTYIKEIKDKEKNVEEIENQNAETDEQKKDENGADTTESKDKKNVYEVFFKNMNLKIPINNNENINLFGYLNCKHEDSDVNILKKIFRFSSNFSTTCNSAFFIQPEYKKHKSAILPNHVIPKRVLTVLDINNEERKLRFNAPAAKRMILNSLSTNHPEIYSYPKYRNMKNSNLYSDHHNQNRYPNDHMQGNNQNYGNFNPKDYNYVHNPRNYDSYSNSSKNQAHHYTQNHPNYNNNYPPLSHNKNAPLYGNSPHSHDNKNDSDYNMHNGNRNIQNVHNYHSSARNNHNNYGGQRNTYNKDPAHHDGSYNNSYNPNYSNNYGKHRNDKPPSSHLYNSGGNYHGSYKNNNYNSGGNNYNNYNHHNNDSPHHSRNSFRYNDGNSRAEPKKPHYYNRSMPYKDKEH
ncbi:exoribonuclease, putative [Plasmodium vinckei brucechwatti]|uniref:Exoribonuclease, putative n=1 Tax=Plasmodium vinckei brucechwatti TaxID=119398 RepID=A0A6V7S8U1_PLAVN|nr:exoribonuclease, putative [Plasmodium vinckei brucechwatti]